MLPLSTAVPAHLPPCPTAFASAPAAHLAGDGVCGSPVTPPRETTSVEMNLYLMSPLKTNGPLAWFRIWLHGHVWKHKGEGWQEWEAEAGGVEGTRPACQQPHFRVLNLIMELIISSRVAVSFL